MIDQSNKGDSS